MCAKDAAICAEDAAMCAKDAAMCAKDAATCAKDAAMRAVRALSVRRTLLFVILLSYKLNSVHLEEHKTSTESDNFKSLYKNVVSK